MERTADEEKEYYSLVKKVFRLLAPVYDIGTMPISGVRDKTVDFTSAVNGSRILDVATGTGKQAFAFAKRGYDITGIDLSEAMLKVASRKNKYENAKFALADVLLGAGRILKEIISNANMQGVRRSKECSQIKIILLLPGFHYRTSIQRNTENLQ